MKYITKVSQTHVIEVNGENRQVKEVDSVNGVYFQYVGVEVYTNLHVTVFHKQHLSEVVLAVEMTKFILENKENT